MAARNRIGRAIAAPILVLNFILYVVVLALAGWALNRAIDYGQSNVVNPTGAGTTATRFPVGAQHIGLWRTESLAGAASASLIAWLLTLLAFGLACKEIHLGGPFRNRRLKTLEAFVIILAATQLIHLLLLHTGIFGDAYGPSFREPGYGEHPKTAAAASDV
ncbi:hypothetical protein O6H91_01G057200 [Diphasiastrum complanatum]|uniref:Uncharacterized protein n=1 Tax=Diphasiastrum complanatum TaxID=34168 RepID=A0ACC2ER07_DIPCM|nr:hypothetical protein O6H91_01G057200 [Diphasiastrum complanatum]